MSNYYVKTIERAAVPRSRRLREAGGYHSGGTSSPGGEYLPLTGGTITGDLRVRGNFIVGDVVIVMDADGRLHISKGVVSDGDLAAFSAEEGEEGGSGGLDIARLWEELAAEDTSKVIDVSHIPGSVVLQDELIEVLDDYPLTTEMNEALSGKAALQHSHAIADVTNLQNALNSKWEWNASQVAGVKVRNAFAADKLASSVKINGTDFNGESDIVTARWGAARTITVWDFYNANKQAAQGIDGSADFALKLPQSLKVKTLNIDGVTLSVVGGRLHVDSTLTADGDLVAYGDAEGSSGGGLDEEAMWKALGGSMENKKISALYLPSLSSLSGNLDSSRITGLSTALTSYAKKDGSNATGTWPISISGNAASADISNYLYLNPNNGSLAAQNDAVPAQSRFAIYNVNANTTAGGNDGFVMAFRWPSGYYVSQIYVDAGSTGIMALRHRNNSNVWSEWYRMLHSGNIGSYALTPSNYTSTLDSRYVNVSGDTMTGPLNINTNGTDYYNEGIRLNRISSNNWACLALGGAANSTAGTSPATWSIGAAPASRNYDLIIANNGSADNTGLRLGGNGTSVFTWKGSTVWHSGNDGSGSGLDADLLDGYQASSFLLKSGGTMSGCLSFRPEASNNNYDENLRLHPIGNWASIVFCGTDNTGDTGTSANTWSMHGYLGNFFINRNGANTTTPYLLCNVNGNWGMGTNAPVSKLDVVGTIRASVKDAPGFLSETVSSQWAYFRVRSGSVFWDIAQIGNTSGMLGQADALELRQNGGDVGIAIRYNTSSMGRLVIVDNTAEASIGYRGMQGHLWTVGLGIGASTNFGWWYSTSGWRMRLDPDGNLYTTGSIIAGDKLFVPSSEGIQKYYIRIE